MSVEQAHLDGTTTPIEEFERERPGTHLWDPWQEEWRVRSRVPIGEIDRCMTVEEYFEEVEPGPTWGGGDFGPEDTAGAYYDITVSTTTEYRFRIPAYSEREAKDIGEEWRLDAHPADERVVHTDTREVQEIQFKELPEDYDPYSGDRIVDALEAQEENDS